MRHKQKNSKTLYTILKALVSFCPSMTRTARRDVGLKRRVNLGPQSLMNIAYPSAGDMLPSAQPQRSNELAYVPTKRKKLQHTMKKA